MILEANLSAREIELQEEAIKLLNLKIRANRVSYLSRVQLGGQR